MKRKIRSFAILCMILLSTMFMLFQESSITPYLSQKNGKAGETSPDNNPISAEGFSDYSEIGKDAYALRSASDFSQFYYLYKNTSAIQADTTLSYLISELWDSSYKGFNDTTAQTAKKRTYDNMLMIISLLDYNDASAQAAYVTKAEETFEFEYQYLWDSQAKLFRSYCDPNGSNPSPRLNSSDNALALIALSRLFENTGNQTYLGLLNQSYHAMMAYFYDTTNGGFYRSNLTSDNAKFAYDNLLVCLSLSEIYKSGHLAVATQVGALTFAKDTMNQLISHSFNGSLGFFYATNTTWQNPVTIKSALVNSLAILSLLSLFDTTSNQTYLNLAGTTAQFVDTAFWDSHGTTRGYNSTVTWDGKTTLDSTKFLEVNSLIMKAFLKLFEKTYNSTHYLDALNISQFLNTYLWDNYVHAFNYSIKFPSSSISTKSAAANAWTIQALLSYRYIEPYLTRANTTMTLLNKYMYSANLFDSFVMYDWSSLSSQVLYQYPLQITFADIFKVTKSASTNLLAIYSLVELAEQTQLDDYLLLANKTMYILNSVDFINAFVTNITGAQTDRTYSTEINAWGILALLKLYEKINDSLFLDMANQTWCYLQKYLWDSVNAGYSTSTKSNTTKDLVSNCLMVWANLEIIKSNYAIFNAIRGNASAYVNQTLNKINQKVWDATNSGYYANITQDWTPITTGQSAKKNYELNLMIQTLLEYNKVYPNHPNRTLYEDRINKTTKFLLKNLWDGEVGGLYYGCYANGSAPVTDKHTYGNNWAVLTFIKLYQKTGNFTYYLLAEELTNFINTYLWDVENGGYFLSCSKDGLPLIIGAYQGLTTSIPLSFKFLENQISAIRALTLLSALKATMRFPLIVDIAFLPEKVDRGAMELQVTLSLIDIDGNPIKQANLSVLTSGLVKTVSSEKLYGFANKTALDNQVGTNDYSGKLDIARFFGNFHLSILAYNYSLAVTWLFIPSNRTFDVYLTKAFALLTSINLGLWDDTYGGYKKTSSGVGNLTKTAFDNWLAILTSLEFFNSSGLNLMYNITTYNIEQLLTTYLLDTFNFLNTTLRFTSRNQTAIAFFTSANRDGTGIQNKILCKDTALAVIALLKYYQFTQNPTYLNIANKTWAYLNSTLWDKTYSGYITKNGTAGTQDKYTEDNLWAILANLAVYNTTQINSTIRTSALKMANLTLEYLLQKEWDNTYSGFFSRFNGTTGLPYNTSTASKQAGGNALAIQALVNFAEASIGSKRQVYTSWANKTYLFMENVLKDKSFLGYFSSCNRNGTAFNTNKTLTENSLMISALIDLYRINNLNYTYYKAAEETIFFIDQYFISSIFTIYYSVASEFGAISYNMGAQFVPIETNSNFLFMRSLIKADQQRQNLNYPLKIKNIIVESPHLGIIQNMVNVTLEIDDSDDMPIQNATVLGVIYGRAQVFTFTKLTGNKYYCILNISNVAGTVYWGILAFKTGYSMGSEQHSFTRYLPTYIQKSYETIVAMLLYLWNKTKNIFNTNQIDFTFGTRDNVLAMEALLDFAKVGGDILWAFDWYANRTLVSYTELVAKYLQKTLGTGPIKVGSQNVTGYLVETSKGIPVLYATSSSNALAVLTFLDLYNRTKNPTYLQQANSTWLYLNKTFWDPVNQGYRPDNSTEYVNKTLYDNCLVILADLAMNETLEINSAIRTQAYRLALTTFQKMNQTMWDTVNGTYYSHCSEDWSYRYNRYIEGNALMILTQLKFYAHNPAQSNYLRMANLTAELLIKHFYDSQYGGFYQLLQKNFSRPIIEIDKAKFLTDQAWVSLAFTELYSITKNSTFYYSAEDAVNFVNSHMANHYNSYLSNEIVDVAGYWDIANQSGWVFGKTNGQYVGSLETASLIIRAMLKLYTIANLTRPWLNATVQLLPASYPPIGEYCNLSISLVNEFDTKVIAVLSVTMSGWQRMTGECAQLVSKPVNYIYDASSMQYKIKDVNLTNLEDVYFTIYAKNTTYATWWGVVYLHRTETTLSAIWAVGGDYISSGNFWQYTISEDVIVIDAKYTDMTTLQGVPGAFLNFTVYFQNATKWFSQYSRTNSTGWARFTFGPVPNVAALFGYYNITVIGSYVNTTISP
ncbi:MAG: AGE family epimerase/isomerase, partial [Candidatus Helarchaeota archaeon]|nr:AGE family epimerase/isomerase [Candidatus Helarchaeota archaeon]